MRLTGPFLISPAEEVAYAPPPASRLAQPKVGVSPTSARIITIVFLLQAFMSIFFRTSSYSTHKNSQ